MVNTFDTSRVGGGTYELEQDSNGNYALKSVGFEQVNKLNLPDLTNLDLPTTTTPPKDEEKKTDVADPFNKLASQQDGGGDNNQDYSGVMLKSPEVKDVSVREAGEATNTTYNAMSDAEKASVAAGTSGMTFRGAGDATKQYTDPEKYGTSLTTTNPMDIREQAAVGNKAQFETFMGDAVTMDGPYSMSTSKTYKTPRTIADQNKYLGRTFTDKTTGLQKPKSVVTDLKNLASKSLAFNAIKGAAQGLGAILGAIAPEETESQKHAKSYFNYSQVGAQAQRISGNPANDLYAGANANAREVSNYGKKRIDTITKTISKMTPEQKAKSSLPARLEKFEKQQKEYVNDRVSKREDKSGSGKKSGFTNPGAKSYGPHSGGGGGGGNGCFLEGTLITMLDGTKKPVEQVDLGNEVAVGGKVFAVGRFLNTELYDYKGIKVSGSHMVNEDGTWLRVRDTKHGKSLGDDLNTVYVFGSENRRILIDDILFTDYFEVSEQDQLINNEEDFFNNWKSYGNTIDEHNVNTLNGS